MSDTFKNQKMLDNEIDFCKQAILQVSTNESSWGYLNGILVNDGIAAHPDVLEFCQVIIGLGVL